MNNLTEHSIKDLVSNYRFINLHEIVERHSQLKTEINLEIYINQSKITHLYGFMTPSTELLTLIEKHLCLEKKQNQKMYIYIDDKRALITIHDGNNIGYYQFFSNLYETKTTFDLDFYTVKPTKFYKSNISCIMVNGKYFNVVIESNDNYYIEYFSENLYTIAKSSVLDSQIYTLNLTKKSDTENTILKPDNHLPYDTQRAILQYLINVRLVNATKQQSNQKNYYVNKLKAKLYFYDGKYKLYRYSQVANRFNFTSINNRFILKTNGKLEYQPINRFNAEIIAIMKKLCTNHNG